MRTAPLLSLGFALLAVLAASRVDAGVVGARLVTDINTEPGGEGSAPRAFTTIAGKVYFRAYEPATGAELYISDGGSAPAQRVLDLARGPGSSNPVALGMAGTRLILVGDDGFRGEQVWAFDTLSGERARLTSADHAQPGYARPLAGAVGAIGDKYIFSRYPEYEIWATDGTPTGTGLLVARPVPGMPEPVTCLLDGLLIAARPVTNGEYDVIASDGTPANTRVLARVALRHPVRTLGNGTHCYFAGRGTGPGSTIWRSDGSVAGTALVYDTAASVQAAALLGTSLYVAEIDDTQFHLRRVGEAAALLTLPRTGSPPAQLIDAGDRLVLIGPYQDGFSNQALFVSDGTAAGTQRLTRPAALEGYETGLRRLGNRALLLGRNAEPWSLDPANASFVALAPDFPGLYSGDIAVLNDVALLAGSDARGAEVWRTDGTAAGTLRLHDVWQSTASGLSYRAPLALALNDVLLFAQVPSPWPDSQTHGLWRSDGTAAGTHELPRSAYDTGNVLRLARFGDGAAFVSFSDGWPPSRLYSTDGDLAAATLRASDDEFAPVVQSIGDPSGGIVFGCEYTGAGNLCGLRVGDAQPVPVAMDLHTRNAMVPVGQIGNAALFFIRDTVGSVRRGLWRSDGTMPGTFRVATDLEPASEAVAPPSHRQGARLLFHACIADTRDCGIYGSDAMAAGAQRIIGVTSPALDFAPLKGRTLILLSGNGTQLLLSDGTSAGTQVLRTFAAFTVTRFAALAGHVYFGIDRTGYEPVWYISDGTGAGTRPLALPATFAANMDTPVVLDADTVLLSCTSLATGAEFCVSNADGSDVRFALDAYPGPQSSAASFLASTADAVYFALDDGSHGNELWRFAALSEVVFADDFE
jgi:ELWxxDGT repeat protein